MTDPTLIKLKKTISDAYTGAWSSEKEILMEECLAKLQTALWGPDSSEPEMTPFELRKDIICQMKKTFQTLSSQTMIQSLEQHSDKTIYKAAKLMMNAQRIICQLKTIKLVEIREELRESKGSLIQGRKSLQQAMENTEDVSTMLKAISGYIKICARIVGMETGPVLRNNVRKSPKKTMRQRRLQ